MSGDRIRVMVDSNDVDVNVFADIIEKLKSSIRSFSVYVDNDIDYKNEAWIIERNSISTITISLIGHDDVNGRYSAGKFIIRKDLISTMMPSLSEIFLLKTKDFITERG